MLDNLRRLGRTWIGKVVGVFLIIGLAGFGISNVITGFGSNTVARVGSEDITAQEFARAYQSQLNAVAQQMGFVPSAEQALQMGIPAGVLQTLATEAALSQVTAQMGLGVSDSKLREIIQSDPNFFSMLQRFDRDIFAQTLAASGYTENEYIELVRAAARRSQYEAGLIGGTYTPQTALDLFNHYQNDQRTIEYFTLDAASIDPVAIPTEEELAAYLTENQTSFRTQEARTADILAFTPELLAAQRTPTEEEIAAEYERTKDQLVKIERRHIVQVSMPDEERAAWFEQQRDSGATFDAALAESGLTSTDLGILARSEVTDPALAEAAFSLAEAGDFTVIPGIGSRRVVAVTEIQPGGPVTLEEARADISARLALDAAKAEYTDIQDQIEELRAAFRPLKEIAERYSLPVATVTLNANGEALSAVNGLAEENRARVAQAIFAAEQGKLSAAIALGGTNNIYYELTGVEAARDQTLDEVRDAVTKAITDQRTAEAIEETAKAAVAELEAEVSMGVLAGQYNKEAVTTQPFGRQGNAEAGITPAIASAVFALGPDASGSVAGPDGTYTVFHITSIVPVETPIADQTKTLVEQATRQAVLAEFIAGIRTAYPLQINQQALSQVLALDTLQ